VATWPFLQKDRPAHNIARVTNVIGDIDGKCAVMTDDMVDTAGHARGRCRVPEGTRREEGLRVCDARHLLAAGDRADRGQRPRQGSSSPTPSPIDPMTKPDRVTVLTVADILAETIHNVFSDDSVSASLAT